MRLVYTLPLLLVAALAVNAQRIPASDVVVITHAEVEQRANALMEFGGLSSVDAHRAASEQVTREALLYAMAVREGLQLSDDAVRAEIQSMWTMTVTDADDTGRRLFERAAAEMGLTIEQFLEHPGVVAAYGRIFSAGRMRAHLFDRLSINHESSTADDEAAIDAYLRGQIRVHLEPAVRVK